MLAHRLRREFINTLDGKQVLTYRAMAPTKQHGTRERILTEGMRLFGEHGYRATRIAAIEEAAGLSPGSGALYKHFRSKSDLLAEGVSLQLASGDELHKRLEQTEPAGDQLHQRLTNVVLAGLDRLESERDLNRLIVRDLRQFPELMERVREREMRRIAVGLGEWLSRQAGGGDRDWRAIATVLTGAVANYWLLRDAFGSHPSGVSETEFMGAAADLVAALLQDGATR